MSQPSPFTPGEIAHEVPGRAEDLDLVADLLAVMATRRRLAGRIHVFIGPRGVGKTSLLREAQRRAEDAHLSTVFVTAGHGHLLTALAEALVRGPLSGSGRVLGERLGELGFEVGVPGARVRASLTPEDPTVVRGLEELLGRAAQASLDEGKHGVVLFVDELQSGDRDSLRALAYAWQHLQADPDGRPLALVCAGLGHTEDVVTDAASFSERFAYRTVGSLTEAAAREALSAPATHHGVAWEIDALTDVVERTQGYPYFIQVHGDAVWRAAGRPDPGGTLTRADVSTAEDAVRRDREALYRSRWSKASPSEQRFLAAMAAEDEDAVRRGRIAETLGVGTEALGMARRSLMDKGLVEVAGYGLLRFTVPGFREYVRETGDVRPKGGA